MKKILKIAGLFPIFSLIFPNQVLAVCPVCTVAVCAGVGLSRWLKVDDTISGVWIGGLIVSSILWIFSFFENKKIYFKFQKIIITALSYFLIIFPLFKAGIIGDLQNKSKYLGIDKLLLGIFSGSLFFVIAVIFNNFLKSKNRNKAYFPFQKVIIPLTFLALNSLIFYFLNKCD